jgi:hypothetical protein
MGEVPQGASIRERLAGIKKDISANLRDVKVLGMAGVAGVDVLLLAKFMENPEPEASRFLGLLLAANVAAIVRWMDTRK